MFTLRKDFPHLLSLDKEKIVYFDNAATSQKPKVMIDAISDYYLNSVFSVGRSSFERASILTDNVEIVRDKIASFIGVKKLEIAFTKSATESLNIVAENLQLYFGADCEVYISEAEHNSNFLPWKNIKILKINLQNNEIEFPIFSNKVKVLSLTASSNLLGDICNIKDILKKAKEYNIVTVIDATQFVAHNSLKDIIEYCDFVVFSAHKMYGPEGLGVLMVKLDKQFILKKFYLGGFILKEFQPLKFKDFPYKLESGTLNVASIIGFGASLDYLDKLSFQEIKNYEELLCQNIFDILKGYDVEIYSKRKNHIISFTFNKLISFDANVFLSENKILLRDGFHCAHFLSQQLSKNGVLRISIAFYNNQNDINNLKEALYNMREFI